MPIPGIPPISYYVDQGSLYMGLLQVLTGLGASATTLGGSRVSEQTVECQKMNLDSILQRENGLNRTD